MSEASSLRVGSLSEHGLREENQDRMSHLRAAAGELFVVADGMGGLRDGAQAAEIVVNAFEVACRAGGPPAEVLRSACRAAHQAMTGDMGSTVVAALFRGAVFYVGHVGDSRAYLFHDGRLRALTRDHSVVQREIDDGVLTAAEARQDSRASTLLRAVGKTLGAALEVQGPFRLHAGDGVLLCSDGLHGFVSDDAIALAISRGMRDPQRIAEILAQEALQGAGSDDNVTVQYIQYEGARFPLYRAVWILAGILLLAAVIRIVHGFMR